jgi:hypothetical protein
MRLTIAAILVLFLSMAFLTAGCDKEKIVESKEYVHDIQYVNLPPDTIVRLDTIVKVDSVAIGSKDTVRLVDTLRINTVIHDTIRTTSVVHDTVRVNVYVHDTVITIRNHYDTVVVTDTVVKTQCTPNTSLAVAAMESQTDPLVLDFINQQIGQNQGWILYLTASQMDIKQVSSSVWDIYAYVDYYASDWSGDYPLEVYWRLTYLGGDPANPNNWKMSDPPAYTGSRRAGISTVSKSSSERLLQK